MMRLLVVEDDPLERDLLAALLRDYDLTVAVDAAEARLALDGAPFDVALCDIGLPGESGMSLMASIRQRYPGTAVVAVSGYSDTATLLSALYAGVDSYVVKPYRLAELNEAIELALSKAAPRVKWEMGARQSQRAIRVALLAAITVVAVDILAGLVLLVLLS
jgi:two-component system OmpR family response regulator